MNVIKVTAAGSKVMIKIKMGRHPEIKAKHKINIMCDGYASQHWCQATIYSNIACAMTFLKVIVELC